MDDAQGEFLGTHGTTPAAVKAFENWDPSRALDILIRKGMTHNMVSATEDLYLC